MLHRFIKGALMAVGAVVVLALVGGLIAGLVSGHAKRTLANRRIPKSTVAPATTTAASTTPTLPTTTTGAPATTTSTFAVRPPPPPPSTQPAVVPLLNQTGSGDASLQAFTVPSGATLWGIGWSYDCSGFGSRGNFIVNIVRPGGGFTSNQGVNELGTSGHSVEYYYDHGPFQLEISSECNWSIKVAAQNG